jgi:hypothetical protein
VKEIWRSRWSRVVEEVKVAGLRTLEEIYGEEEE